MSLEAIIPLLKDIQDRVTDLEAKALLNHRQTVVMAGLSDITERLGLIRAGEFRAGNSNIPGDGFTGIRLGYPGWTYNGETWNLAGVNNDVLQAGLRATDGKFLAGEGAVVLDSNGLGLHVTGSATSQGDISWYDANDDILAGTFTSYTGTVGSLLLISGPGGSTRSAHILRLEARGGGVSPFIELWGAGTGEIRITNTTNKMELTLAETVFNQDGEAGIDLRVEGDTNENLLFIDAGVENITVGAVAISANYDLMLAGDGVLGLKETTTPTADTNYGKVYTKNDNKLYFQDGAGTEHEIAYV